MPLIICTVTNDLSQDQRMQRIATALTGAGYEVWLVGRRRRDSLPLPEQPYRQWRLPCRFERGKLFYLEYNLRLLWFLLRHRFDIVNAVDLDTLLPAYLVSRWRGRPCVYDAHEYFTETPEVVRRPAVQRAWSWLADRILPRLRYAYTVGDALAQLMSERYGIPFAVIRNLPLRRTTAEAISPGATKPIILYQGVLNEGRGLEVAIRAMRQLPEAELHLAGTGDLVKELQGLTLDLQLTERVKFLGFIPPADLPALTQHAWLGLNLLENRGLSYYYSLANKAFDYIQAGVPSLQMDFPEYRRLQDTYHTFILIDELKEDAVVRAVRSLLAEPNHYATLTSNCRRAAKELNWEQEVGKLVAFYENVVNNTGRRPTEGEAPPSG